LNSNALFQKRKQKRKRERKQKNIKGVERTVSARARKRPKAQ
jgi:hypothetical protein